MSDKRCNMEYTDVKVGYCFPHYGQKSCQILIDMIGSSKSTLDIAIFNFMDKDILNAILEAIKRGVAVRIITDKRLSLINPIQYFVLRKLKKAGALIKKNKHPGSMHLKITNADKKIVAAGSANYTKSAQKKNDEFFIVFYDERVANDYFKEFEIMWNKEDAFRFF